MKWFVISPLNGMTVFDADTQGQKKVLEFVESELMYYNGKEGAIKTRPEDYYIFRGERHEYTPPKKTASLIQTDSNHTCRTI